MFAPEPAATIAPTGPVARQALEAQARLLPYALGFFGICLPVFVVLAAHAPNAPWLAVSLGLFAFDWAIFYAVVDWIRTDPRAQSDLALRMRVQLGAGLLWALSIGQTAAFAAAAGPLSGTLLLLCVGAATGVIFFASPVLEHLLFLSPAAAAGPYLFLARDPQTHDEARMALCALALAMALALILNRHLREHFAMAVEREALIGDRERALAQSRRLAKAKSDIVATLAHEIRNGLSGVAHVLSGALSGGPRGAPPREQLKAALHAARDLVAVLDATLDSEIAEEGRLPVANLPIDLARITEETCLLLRPAAQAKGLELSVLVEPDLRTDGAALGDASRVRQVLNNLIGNAVKYTVRGRIEVRARRMGDRAGVEVADSGPGMSAPELEAAFEPFSRIARTGAGVPGAGLGLSLSRRLAELMGGAIEADSAPGVGSRFLLSLKFDASARLTIDPDGSAIAYERPLRVLIVEDDALNAAMLRAVLEQLGHRVMHAHDGRRAVELAQMSQFDLIMLDGRMPVMGGAETARALAGVTQAPLVAVIGGDADEAQAMLDAGVRSVLRKPVAVATVARAVADACAPIFPIPTMETVDLCAEAAATAAADNVLPLRGRTVDRGQGARR